MGINRWCSLVNARIQQIMRHGGTSADQTIRADCDIVDDGRASRNPRSRTKMHRST